MADSAGFELAHDLVRKARDAGFYVTTSQIARWNREGLLPKPRQSGLGRGGGSEVRYQTGTGDQLLALCGLHREYRNFEKAGWYLWLNGFSVSDRYWRTPLLSAALNFIDKRRLFKKKLLDVSQGIVSVRATGARVFEELSTVPINNRHFRRARRRVGSRQIGEFCRLMTTIAVGAYRAYSQHHEDERATESKVIERGLGLARAYRDQLDNGLTLLTKPVEADLEQLSVRVGKVSKPLLLRTITSEKMERARDELRLLLSGLRSTYLNLEARHGRHAFGLGVIADLAMITDIKLQALMILLFETTIRSDPRNRLREILAVIKAKRATDGRQLDAP